MAEGGGKDSPGVVSGNGVQLPVHLPVNLSGNTVNVVGAGNAAVGNESTNSSGPDRPDRPDLPVKPSPRPSAPPHGNPAPEPAPYTPPQHMASLARTGADATVPAVVGSAALVLGGAAVYRRFRPRAVR